MAFLNSITNAVKKEVNSKVNLKANSNTDEAPVKSEANKISFSEIAKETAKDMANKAEDFTTDMTQLEENGAEDILNSVADAIDSYAEQIQNSALNNTAQSEESENDNQKDDLGAKVVNEDGSLNTENIVRMYSNGEISFDKLAEIFGKTPALDNRHDKYIELDDGTKITLSVGWMSDDEDGYNTPMDFLYIDNKNGCITGTYTSPDVLKRISDAKALIQECFNSDGSINTEKMFDLWNSGKIDQDSIFYLRTSRGITTDEAVGLVSKMIHHPKPEEQAKSEVPEIIIQECFNDDGLFNMEHMIDLVNSQKIGSEDLRDFYCSEDLRDFYLSGRMTISDVQEILVIYKCAEALGSLRQK